MAIPIRAVLTVSTVAFKKGIGIATKAVGGLAAATKFATVALTALSATFIAVVVKQTQAIDRLGKTASKLGVSVEFLQQLRFAAEQSGVAVETTDMAFQRFSRRLGEAQKGIGELLPALRDLGIKQADLVGLKPEEAFLLFADALSTVDNESNKLALTFKAVDSEGVGLINLIGDGRDKFLEFAAEAKSLGFILSNDAVRGVEQFNDDLNELFRILDGVVKQIVAALAPALAILVQQFKNFILEIAGTEGGFEKLALEIKDNLLEAFNSFLLGLEKVVHMLGDLFGLVIKIGRVADPNFGITPEKVKELEEARKQLTFIDAALARQDVGNLPIFGGINKFIIGIGDAIGLADDELLAFIEKFGELTREEALLLKGTLRAQIREIEQTDIFQGFDTSGLREKIREAIGKGFSFGLKDGAQDPDSEQEILSFFQKIADKFAIALGTSVATLGTKIEASGFGDFTRAVEEGLVKAAKGFEDALVDAIVTGKANFETFREILRQALARAIVTKFITGPIFDLFKAKGGPVKAGNPYIVGEEGPELFVPGATGTIIPNNNLQGSGRGAGGTVINISAVDTQSFQQAIARDPEFIFNVSRVGARRQPA